MCKYRGSGHPFRYYTGIIMICYSSELHNVAFVACFLFFSKRIRGKVATARNGFGFSSKLRTTIEPLYADNFSMPVMYQ